MCCLCWGWRLKLEARLARGIGQRANPPVVLKSGSIESYFSDTGGLGPLGERAANGLGGLDIASALEAFTHITLHGRSSNDDLRAGGVHQLRINVPGRAMHDQPRNIELAD